MAVVEQKAISSKLSRELRKEDPTTFAEIDEARAVRKAVLVDKDERDGANQVATANRQAESAL